MRFLIPRTLSQFPELTPESNPIRRTNGTQWCTNQMQAMLKRRRRCWRHNTRPCSCYFSRLLRHPWLELVHVYQPPTKKRYNYNGLYKLLYLFLSSTPRGISSYFTAIEGIFENSSCIPSLSEMWCVNFANVNGYEGPFWNNKVSAYFLKINIPRKYSKLKSN